MLLSFLTEVDDWKTAREILKEELLEHQNMDPKIQAILPHLFEFYVKETAHYGQAGLVIGEPTSTQSGERMWRTVKGLKVTKGFDESDDIISTMGAIADFCSFDKPFAAQPVQIPAIWNQIHRMT
jgi:hypothetical protein